MLDHRSCRRLMLVLTTTLLQCAGTTAPTTVTSQPVQHQRLVRVFGKVTAKGADGALAPVANALVAVLPERSGAERLDEQALTTSDADGRFSFELDPGVYTLGATAPSLVAAAIRVSVRDEGSVPPVEVRLASGDALELHGALTDATQKPQAGARVVAWRSGREGRQLFVARADGDGNYRMRVPRAKYDLVAMHQALRSREVVLPADTFDTHTTDLILLADPDRPASPNVIAWLRERAVPFERVGDDIRIADSDGILRIVGDARVVGLGESSHGGHEFALTKVRLFQTLVEKAGFTVFAIEASHPECADIDQYVSGGEGDPALLLSRLRFWVTDIDELLGLVKWMRAYNADAAHAKKLHFVGVDPQFAPRAAIIVLQYLHRVDPKLEQQVAADLGPLAGEFDFENLRRLPQPVRDRAAVAIAAVVAKLEQRQSDYRRLASEHAWQVASDMARTASQALQLKSCRRPACRAPDLRDRFMADTVLRLLEHEPGTRMTLWAANAHVATESFLDWEAMGVDLRKALKGDYVAIGFAFNRGAVNAFGDDPFAPVMPFRVEPALPGSVDETLARVGPRAFVADLRGVSPSDEAGRWLAARHRTHDNGSSYSEAPSDEYWPLVRPSEAYDALVYLDEVTPSRLRHPRPLFTPECHAQPINLDFEHASGGAPVGWSVPVRSLRSGYRAQLVASGCAQGRSCALLDRPGTVEVPHYGSLTQDIEAGPYRGHQIRLSAMVRVERPAAFAAVQQAQLWVEVLGAEGNPLQLTSMPAQAITSASWQRHSVTVTVPPAAARVRFGIVVDGNMRAWLDDVAVERVE